MVADPPVREPAADRIVERPRRRLPALEGRIDRLLFIEPEQFPLLWDAP